MIPILGHGDLMELVLFLNDPPTTFPKHFVTICFSISSINMFRPTAWTKEDTHNMRTEIRWKIEYSFQKQLYRIRQGYLRLLMEASVNDLGVFGSSLICPKTPAFGKA